MEGEASDMTTFLATPSSAVFERLAARDAARKAEILSSRKARNLQQANREIILPPLKLSSAKSTVSNPMPAYLRNISANFLENLSIAKNVIIVEINELFEYLSGNSLPVSQKIKLLDDVLSKIEDLQRWFSESSAHLKAFHIEQARLELEDLKSKFHETREKIIPKKKFAFGSKCTKSKPISQPRTSNLRTAESDFVSKESTPLIEQPPPKYSFSNLTDCNSLRLPSGDEPESVLNDQSVYLSNLTRCVIYIEGVSGNVMAHRLVECTIYSQPVASSFQMHNCENCHFILACRQLRIHNTINTRLDIFVASPPIIEDSTSVTLAPYPLGAAHSQRFSDNLLTAGLADVSNNWCFVQDFSCPTLQTETIPISTSPNWSLVPESEWIQSDIPTCPKM